MKHASCDARASRSRSIPFSGLFKSTLLCAAFHCSDFCLAWRGTFLGSGWPTITVGRSGLKELFSACSLKHQQEEAALPRLLHVHHLEQLLSCSPRLFRTHKRIRNANHKLQLTVQSSIMRKKQAYQLSKRGAAKNWSHVAYAIVYLDTSVCISI